MGERSQYDFIDGYACHMRDAMRPRPTSSPIYMVFPEDHRVKLYSTNPLERINGKIKWLTEVVGIFPNEAVTRKLTAISTPRFDPGSFRGPERDSKYPKFQDQITPANQPLKNPYCFAEVRRFGEYGPERDEFGLRRGSLGQQLWCVNRTDTGVFVGAARRRRALSR